MNLAYAVSVFTSLSAEEKIEVRAALENATDEFSRMEETFTRNRFKTKWVQSTNESGNLGRETRIMDKLVDACNKSKSLPSECLQLFSALYPMNKEYNLTLFESSLSSQRTEGELLQNVEECDPVAKYRSIDGTCNNLAVNHKQGAAATPMPRLMDNAYSDGKFP